MDDPGVLRDREISLRINVITPGNRERGFSPAYHFNFFRNGYREIGGKFALRIGWTRNLLMYGGHVGYELEPIHRGHHFAERAVRLMLPLAWGHGLPEVWITCNPDNLASIRTCERLGATFVENVPLPPTSDMALRGEMTKNRYVLRRPPA